MYYLYILLSLIDRKFYIGFTVDLEKRLKEHDAGKTTSTRSRRPFKLIYYEAHLSKEDAMRREHYFKTTKGKSTLRQMLRTTLFDLGILTGKTNDEHNILSQGESDLSQIENFL